MVVFFFNDTATTEIYTLSLHDALPIFLAQQNRTLEQLADDSDRVLAPLARDRQRITGFIDAAQGAARATVDRKSTRLNSSHANISYAVFCLKKKKTTYRTPNLTYDS